MRLKLFVLAACGLFAGCLQAQVGGYVLATGQHMTGINGSAKFSPVGYTIGGYYDFFSAGRVRIGADARFMSTSSKKGATTGANVGPSGVGGRIYSGLGGVRASIDFKIKTVAIKPYLQASAGLVRTNYGVLYPDPPTSPGVTDRYSNLGVSGFAGADISLLPMVSLRLEGGSGVVHGGPASGSYPLQSYSVGIVFHSSSQR
ncbi:MAG: hypothetical protein JSS87_02625 [Acidobacteria bacterium]|nr:hypothetical protein [Acidobacteriota bacterium]